MNAVVNVIIFGKPSKGFAWDKGSIFYFPESPREIDALWQKHSHAECDAWLFWDSSLGSPDLQTILSILQMPGDVWHAGVSLGLRGLPGLLDFVNPTWMFTQDPDPTIVATSWRLSLRACLFRSSVLKQLTFINPDFQTLEGASLELGHRYLMSGVILRQMPLLIPNRAPACSAVLPLSDEFLFMRLRTGNRWARWSIIRALLSGYSKMTDGIKLLRHATPQTLKPAIFQHAKESPQFAKASVSVLIPTLDRYNYLRKLLPQLKQQTIPPLEIIIVDQTPPHRRVSIGEEFPELPLQVIYRERPGQCSARNHGLNVARGEYILFLDDDDEVPPDLIENHLNSLTRFRAKVSSGVADEVGAGPLPYAFTYIRCSDVFPTNNTLIHRSVLESSGLFDLGHDGGERDDADLGMRIYLAGHLMILNPRIRILHHHAPVGGLRAHRSRVITYAKSRASLGYRHLPSVSQLYLNRRYFSNRQNREAILLAILGTFAYHGSSIGKFLKVVLGLLFMPHTLWRIHVNSKKTNEMMKHFPQFPFPVPLKKPGQPVQTVS